MVSVCMSDCLSVSVYICNAITFESLDVESSFFVCGYIFGGCRSTQLNADEQIQAQSISENEYFKRIQSTILSHLHDRLSVLVRSALQLELNIIDQAKFLPNQDFEVLQNEHH